MISCRITFDINIFILYSIMSSCPQVCVSRKGAQRFEGLTAGRGGGYTRRNTVFHFDKMTFLFDKMEFHFEKMSFFRGIIPI